MTDFTTTTNHGADNAKQHTMTLLQQQRFAEAIPYAASACESNPDDAESWLAYAIACSQTGDLGNAERHCRRALEITPSYLGAYLTLAGIQQGLGKIEDAINTYRQVLALKPDMIEALNNLGSLMRETGDLDQAEYCLNTALGIRPNGPIILNNLGLLQKDRGNLDSAIDFYSRAISQRPDFADAHLNIANALQMQGKIAEAERNYRKAIELQPDFFMAHHALGQLLTSQARLDEALLHLEKARTLQPGITDITVSIAEVHEKRGEHQKALETIEPLIESPVPLHSAALCFAHLAPRFGRESEARELLERLLPTAGQHPAISRDIHYALGDLLDRSGEYEAAFNHYRNANETYPATAAKEIPRMQIDAIMGCYGADAYRKHAKSGVSSGIPLFIVGLPRSGTTLVEQILASHSRVFGAGEVSYLGDILNSLPGRFGADLTYPSSISSLTTAQLDEMANDYLERLISLSPGSEIITDKMPHNFLHLGLISRMFPNARIIHCTRDPMDTCLSIYFHNFSTNHPYATDLQELGRYYKAYRGLMDHWRNILDIPLMDVPYEALVNNQEDTTRKMIDFCGLEWEERCMKFHDTKRPIATPSRDQVRRPMYGTSIHRWRNYERFLQPLISSLA